MKPIFGPKAVAHYDQSLAELKERFGACCSSLREAVEEVGEMAARVVIAHRIKHEILPVSPDLIVDLLIEGMMRHNAAEDRVDWLDE